MSAPIAAPLDPLIEGYLSYLDKVGRKTPRTIVDVRCTLRRAIAVCDAGQAAALQSLMQPQLPQITQRLQTTLEKLRSPALTDSISSRRSSSSPQVSTRNAERAPGGRESAA